MSASPPLRQPCPPGACVCERERLEAPGADRRILLLTRQEEQRLAARLEALRSLEDRNTCCFVEVTGHCLRISPGRKFTSPVLMRFEEFGECRKRKAMLATAFEPATTEC